MQQNHNLAYLTRVSKKYLKRSLKKLGSANVALKDLAIKIEEKRFLRLAIKVILKFLNQWCAKGWDLSVFVNQKILNKRVKRDYEVIL